MPNIKRRVLFLIFNLRGKILNLKHIYFSGVHLMLKINPAVFAVGKFYQIIALSGCESMMWVKIGGRCYYDHSNGILRSKKNVHKITVPMAELDKEKNTRSAKGKFTDSDGKTLEEFEIKKNNF